MVTRVELINNPYKQQLRILMNGEAVSVYSNLEKFMDEPFSYWCDRILEGYEEKLRLVETFQKTKEFAGRIQELLDEYERGQKKECLRLARELAGKIMEI